MSAGPMARSGVDLQHAPLVPEVLVNGDHYAVIRPRVSVEQLIAMDQPAPWL